jgi:hypothetical protein
LVKVIHLHCAPACVRLSQYNALLVWDDSVP